jgi:hypothetical protein
MSSLDYELFADDLLTIDFDQNSIPGAWPYLRRLKLRGDSIRTSVHLCRTSEREAGQG